MILVCGFNGFGQCASLTGANGRNEFVIREWLRSDEHASDLSITWNSILLITNDGTAKVFGFNPGGAKTTKLEHPDNQNFIQGSCSRTKYCLLSNNGIGLQYNASSASWKDLTRLLYAQRIDESTDISLVKVSCNEMMVAALSKRGMAYNVPNVLSPSGIVVLDIACGNEHGIILTDRGLVYTWGGGSRGQLGNGSLESSEELCEVELLGGLFIKSIAAGGWHNCAITREGDLYTWGWNKQGQLGHPILGDAGNQGISVQAQPIIVDWPIGIEVNVEQVSCGTSHTVAKLDDGSLWGCGWNRWGQLLNGPTARSSMTQILVPEGVKVSKIICGAWNTALVCTD